MIGQAPISHGCDVVVVVQGQVALAKAMVVAAQVAFEHRKVVVGVAHS